MYYLHIQLLIEVNFDYVNTKKIWCNMISTNLLVILHNVLLKSMIFHRNLFF